MSIFFQLFNIFKIYCLSHVLKDNWIRFLLRNLETDSADFNIVLLHIEGNGFKH